MVPPTSTTATDAPEASTNNTETKKTITMTTSNATTEQDQNNDDKNKDMWYVMYEQLCEYRVKHGDCLVPQRYKENAKLGRWVNKQRENKDKSLSSERMKLLDSIGFTWSVVKREPWDSMFQRLLTYKKKNGDCLVPQRYKSDPRLGGWVREQRKRKDHLNPQRRECLDAIGFTWRVKDHHQQIRDVAAAQFNTYVAAKAQQQQQQQHQQHVPSTRLFSLPGGSNVGAVDLCQQQPHARSSSLPGSMSPFERRFTNSNLHPNLHHATGSSNIYPSESAVAGRGGISSSFMTDRMARMLNHSSTSMRAGPSSSSSVSAAAAASLRNVNSEELLHGLVATENDIRMNEMRMNDLRLRSLLLEKKKREVLSAAVAKQTTFTCDDNNNKDINSSASSRGGGSGKLDGLLGYQSMGQSPLPPPQAKPTNHPWAA